LKVHSLSTATPGTIPPPLPYTHETQSVIWTKETTLESTPSPVNVSALRSGPVVGRAERRPVQNLARGDRPPAASAGGARTKGFRGPFSQSSEVYMFRGISENPPPAHADQWRGCLHESHTICTGGESLPQFEKVFLKGDNLSVTQSPKMLWVTISWNLTPQS